MKSNLVIIAIIAVCAILFFLGSKVLNLNNIAAIASENISSSQLPIQTNLKDIKTNCVVVKDGNNEFNPNDYNSSIIYDGSTISQCIKSDTSINEKALEITKGDSTNLEKVKSIYVWIARNINYSKFQDQELNNGVTLPSGICGAVSTFNNRSGVCLGFASLFVAMARANNVPVRLVVGQGYGGSSWGNHAWNQAYIPSLGGWMNVDTTFASDFFKNEKESNAPYDPVGVLTNYPQIFDSGNEQIEIPAENFFGNKDFDSTHRKPQVIGQWGMN